MNDEGVEQVNQDLVEVADNTATTNSGDKEYNDFEGQVKSGADLGNKQLTEQQKDELLRQTQQINHNQINEINKLKKDLHYWQQKCINLKLDYQTAEFDLKKTRKVKGTHSKENKSLKEQVSQLQSSMEEKEKSYAEMNVQFAELKAENEQLRKKQEEKPAEKQDLSSIEQDVVSKVLSLPDLNSMYRVIYSLNAHIQQKAYTQAYNQQKAAAEATSGSNGHIYPNGEGQMNGNAMYMPGYPMFNQMQYNQMGGYPDSSAQYSNVNNQTHASNKQ